MISNIKLWSNNMTYSLIKIQIELSNGQISPIFKASDTGDIQNFPIKQDENPVRKVIGVGEYYLRKLKFEDKDANSILHWNGTLKVGTKHEFTLDDDEFLVGIFGHTIKGNIYIHNFGFLIAKFE